MKIRENVNISELTTMRLGGPAKFVIEIENESDIESAFNFAIEKNLKVFVLGGGANTLGYDEGFNGAIITNKIKGLKDENGIITAMGGEEWDNVVAFATEKDYTGIEALSKIPGSAGAAPVQNIGAYGQDISDTFLEARVYDRKEKTFKTLKKSDFDFSYRKSILNTTDKDHYFVISISLKLKKGEMERPFYNSIEKYIAENNETDFSPKNIRKIVSEIRKDKLPDPKVRASAGSFFKNVYLNEVEASFAEEKGLPVYHGHDGLKINSGFLIEKAGLKGKLLHGMRISDKAALVLINESATSYADLAAARAEIKEAVKNDSGYELEQEPVELV
ncbi:MAG: UDP-N-acetylmuramate dehydrogenase [Candidatus Saccharibacteria bacterium]|nr:UDP-N-acetylmuramate dehydrogenase [Candidatus Saccharibacteria bacterium]